MKPSRYQSASTSLTIYARPFRRKCTSRRCIRELPDPTVLHLILLRHNEPSLGFRPQGNSSFAATIRWLANLPKSFDGHRGTTRTVINRRYNAFFQTPDRAIAGCQDKPDGAEMRRLASQNDVPAAVVKLRRQEACGRLHRSGRAQRALSLEAR